MRMYIYIYRQSAEWKSTVMYPFRVSVHTCVHICVCECIRKCTHTSLHMNITHTCTYTQPHADSRGDRIKKKNIQMRIFILCMYLSVYVCIRATTTRRLAWRQSKRTTRSRSKSAASRSRVPSASNTLTNSSPSSSRYDRCVFVCVCVCLCVCMYAASAIHRRTQVQARAAKGNKKFVARMQSMRDTNPISSANRDMKV
jgi:hypothetical protein